MFITGGTGYLGAEICRACAEYGARVIFSYNKNEEKARELLSALPGTQAVQMNIANVDEINGTIEGLYRKEEKIDVLVKSCPLPCWNRKMWTLP